MSLRWIAKTGESYALCNMTDSHLIYTAVKIERDGMPQKIGKNEALKMYPNIVKEIDYRGLNAKLDDWRITDAKARGDVRRVVKGVKIKEEHDVERKRQEGTDRVS